MQSVFLTSICGRPSTNVIFECVGPMEDTVSDFWRMIWEQHLELVLMLTNLEEYSKTKCAKYWPDSSESKCFGDVSVTHVSEKKCSGENLVLVCCSK